MSVLTDRDLDRIASLLALGSMKNAGEIAKLVRQELCADRPKTPTLDPLSRLLSDFMRNWAGKF
jgi:hypothetical protein